MPKAKQATEKPKISKKGAKPPEKSVSTPSKNKVKKPIEPVREVHFCTFCGKPSGPERYMIAGPPPNNSFICEKCIEVCISVLLHVGIEDKNDNWRNRLLDLLANPKKSYKPPVKKSKKEKS
jgi:hypothetical protein